MLKRLFTYRCYSFAPALQTFVNLTFLHASFSADSVVAHIAPNTLHLLTFPTAPRNFTPKRFHSKMDMATGYYYPFPVHVRFHFPPISIPNHILILILIAIIIYFECDSLRIS